MYMDRHIIRDHVPSKVFASFVAHSYRVQDPLHHLSVLAPPEGCSVYSTPGDTADYYGGCDVATNGGFFVPKGQGMPLGCVGPVVSNGEVVQGASKQNVFLGIERIGGSRYQYSIGYASPYEVNKRDWLQLLSGVVWLVKDGKSFVQESLTYDDFSAETSGDGQTFANLVAPRLAAGFDASGAFMLVAIDGSEPDWQGLSLYDFAAVLIGMGVRNAINLDGGGSVSVFEDDNVVNVPSDTCPDVTFPRYRCPRAVGSVLCVHAFQSVQTRTRTLKTLHRTGSPSLTASLALADDIDPVHRPAWLRLFHSTAEGEVVVVLVVFLLLALAVWTVYRWKSSRRRRFVVRYETVVDCDGVGEEEEQEGVVSS